jgi:hypothetical protein
LLHCAPSFIWPRPECVLNMQQSLFSSSPECALCVRIPASLSPPFVSAGCRRPFGYDYFIGVHANTHTHTHGPRGDVFAREGSFVPFVRNCAKLETRVRPRARKFPSAHVKLTPSRLAAGRGEARERDDFHAVCATAALGPLLLSLDKMWRRDVEEALSGIAKRVPKTSIHFVF